MTQRCYTDTSRGRIWWMWSPLSGVWVNLGFL
jgi:hypothetical protein